MIRTGWGRQRRFLLKTRVQLVLISYIISPDILSNLRENQFEIRLVCVIKQFQILSPDSSGIYYIARIWYSFL